MDPYRLTYRLLQRLQKQGASVFDRTRVEEITPTTRGVTLRTDTGLTVRAGHLVVAAGYASQHWLKKSVARNRSSYAVISDPLPEAALGFLADTLLWETARPICMRAPPPTVVCCWGEKTIPSISRPRATRAWRRRHARC